jgi:hypothetical protein
LIKATAFIFGRFAGPQYADNRQNPKFCRALPKFTLRPLSGSVIFCCHRMDRAADVKL